MFYTYLGHNYDLISSLLEEYLTFIKNINIDKKPDELTNEFESFKKHLVKRLTILLINLTN
ncbi:hypothetical protein KQ874_00575 [Mycoplasma sp. ES3157-GEN-MYC]|uniref:hypothetical protein n=1 Tax=Mycoplasma miroungigenitalium TaxID=754515 RepID=UPI001C113182|nr:hypothetical protein [Mycoplasma miroungigenitalium]MBU4690200.1 hypothetical protein [Mycoplasma miroungigenitalium]